MQLIVLIACASKKRNSKAAARVLYISPLFKKSLKYAESLHPNKIFILSAKHHLLSLGKVVSPYNLTLNDFRKDDLIKWAAFTLRQIQKEAKLEKDHFVFLAGENYRKHLVPGIKNYSVPLEGMSIGKQLNYLSKRLERGAAREREES